MCQYRLFPARQNITWRHSPNTDNVITRQRDCRDALITRSFPVYPTTAGRTIDCLVSKIDIRTRRHLRGKHPVTRKFDTQNLTDPNVARNTHRQLSVIRTSAQQITEEWISLRQNTKHDGTCPSGCALGWTGRLCKTKDECRHGFYGRDCTLECGHCRNNKQCRKYDGTCPSGCADGWSGKLCKTNLCPDHGQDMLYSINNFCYYVFNNGSNYNTANNACCQLEGHLLWLQSSDDYEFAVNKIDRKLMPVWIGAVRNRFHRYAWTYCGEPQILVNSRYWAEAHPQIQNTHAMFYGEKAVSTCAVDIHLPYVCQGMYSHLFFIVFK
ncbi:unnamed protein product [Acanthosepion pharaonis]|uniref:C-type lectin domain-containing protein n=1 Tax=Acanthosepion pharaonis TaxID=158019 RepID=A0A812D262_ACAPH|nr:unnamed protein product [Sepia pharaonis]